MDRRIKKDIKQMNDDEKQAVDIPVERNYHSKKERKQKIKLKWRKKIKNYE
jgi:hypothetical protein